MLYLASFVDVNSRKIVGWAMDINIDDNLVIKALMQAKDRENPEKGLIIHTDRGSQYTSRKFQQLIKEFDFVSSMSRPGNCYDNALIESVNGTIKKELVYQSEFETVKQAKTELFKLLRCFTTEKDCTQS